MPTWDEPKRLRNIKNHGLDFVGCEAVFDGPVVTWEDARDAYGEHRMNLLGWLEGIVVHDAHSPDPTMAFAISRLTDSGYLNTSPIGIFRQVERETYDDGARAQVASASTPDNDTADQSARLAALIGGGDTWTVL